MCSLGNSTPVSSCMYSNSWSEHKDVVENSWIVREADDFYVAHITAPAQADAEQNNNKNTKDELEKLSKPLREKNSKKNSGGYKHVPHKDKPPQVVAKRNARERKRVQAVNSAFVRLRKAVPIENSRGKRVSKVKTLQNAIQYIQRLQQLLQQDRGYCPINDAYAFHNATKKHEDFFEELIFQDEL